MTGESTMPQPGDDGSKRDRPGDPAKGQTHPTLRCELCGGPVLDRHCKIVCLNCGYQRDCSDP